MRNEEFWFFNFHHVFKHEGKEFLDFTLPAVKLREQ